MPLSYICFYIYFILIILYRFCLPLSQTQTFNVKLLKFNIIWLIAWYVVQWTMHMMCFRHLGPRVPTFLSFFLLLLFFSNMGYMIYIIGHSETILWSKLFRWCDLGCIVCLSPQTPHPPTPKCLLRHRVLSDTFRVRHKISSEMLPL